MWITVQCANRGPKEETASICQPLCSRFVAGHVDGAPRRQVGIK